MLDYKSIIIKHYVLNMSGRSIAKEMGISKSGVNDFLKAFDASDKISYPLPPDITNEGIYELVYDVDPNGSSRNPSFTLPDYQRIHDEMESRNNMTLVYCWNQYKASCEAKKQKYYQYRQFCEHYRRWCDEKDVTTHFNAVPGQTMEVDFAGKTFKITNKWTGEKQTIVVFVAVLPYSQYIYAEGMTSTKEPQWIDVNNHALKAFGGVPPVVICDNCKQAVILNVDWIDPELNKDYAEWGDHNHTAILPAKVRRPRWKSSVENAVGVLEKGIFHDLEKRQYFTLEKFNKDLWELLDGVNHAPFTKKDHSRVYYWEEEKKELMALPDQPYEFTERATPTVSSDYHIHFDYGYYSVDKKYLHKKVLVKATASTVKIYTMRGEFIREWPRAAYKGQWQTDPKDLPAKYSEYAEWNSTYFISLATSVGPYTVQVIENVLKSRKMEVQTYRQCRGILNYSRKYGSAALEECCRQAIIAGRPKYTFIKNTIESIAEGMKLDHDQKLQEKKNQGGYVMNAKATSLNTLLYRSEELIKGNGKENK